MKLNSISFQFVCLFLVNLISFNLQAGDKLIERFTVAAPKSAPLVFKDETGKPQGFLVEYFELVQQQTDLTIDVSVMPWARALHEVKIGRVNALMPAIYTDERAQFLYYPKLPLFNSQRVLVKRVNDPITFNDVKQIGKDKTIVKIRSMSMGRNLDFAEKLNLITVVEVRDFDHAIQMLVSEHADIVICDKTIAHSSITRLGLKGKIEVLKFDEPTEAGYLTFSKMFAKEYNVDELMEKIQLVQSLPQYQKLKEKYLK